MHISCLISLLTFTPSASSKPITPRSFQMYLPERLVALEEHIVSSSLEAEAIATAINVTIPGILDKLNDVGDDRLAAMKAGHISLAILAQQAALGMEDPGGCIEANNALRDAVAANPTRFAGFAVLPLNTPEQAAAELERSVKQLGFKGAMIWNHLKDGTYFDEDEGRFDSTFSKAQELDVPLYLHLAPPTPEISAALFAGDYVQPQAAGRLRTFS